MNDTLTPEQVTKYYKEQTNLAAPLSPKDWLKSQNTTPTVPAGWDDVTYSNFKRANPTLEPDAEDTFLMQNAGRTKTPLKPTIDASSLGSVKIPDISSLNTPTDPTNYNAITQTVQTTGTPSATGAASSGTFDASSRSKALTDRLSSLYGQGQALTDTTLERFGINKQQKDIDELSGQLLQIKAQAEAIPLQVSQESLGRGRTKAGVAPIVSARNRENAIQALTIGSQISALQGRLDTAIKQADQATKYQFLGIENEIAREKKRLELLDTMDLSLEQQKILEERKAVLEATTKEKDAQKELTKDFNTRIVTAQSSGLGIQEASQARELFNAGRTDEANAIISQYVFDKDRFQSVGEGSTIFDRITGKPIYTAPKTYAPGTGSSTVDLTASQKSRVDQLNAVTGSLKYYRNLYNQLVGDSGINLTGADAGRIAGAYNTLLFQVAQAAGTGALQAADREVVENMIPNPTTVGGATGGTSREVSWEGSLLSMKPQYCLIKIKILSSQVRLRCLKQSLRIRHQVV
jgi:hypothetical protein